jgi:hypothetical protein
LRARFERLPARGAVALRGRLAPQRGVKI